ncbi:MAG: hypothetical protein ABFR97_04195 [Thermodesulfobacteriota bacterium]
MSNQEHMSSEEFATAVAPTEMLPADRREHLRSCPACQAELATFKREIARTAERLAPEKRQLQRIRAKFWQETATTRATSLFFGPRALSAMAAVLLLILAVAYPLSQRKTLDEGTESQQTIMAERPDYSLTSLASNLFDQEEEKEPLLAEVINQETLAAATDDFETFLTFINSETTGAET